MRHLALATKAGLARKLIRLSQVVRNEGMAVARPETPDRDVEAAEATGRGRNSALAVILRSIEIMQSQIEAPPSEATVITIAPTLQMTGGAKLKNFAAGRRFIEAGEAAVETQLPRLASAPVHVDVGAQRSRSSARRRSTYCCASR